MSPRRIAAGLSRMRAFPADERGSVLPLVGICIFAIFAVGVIVVDLGFQEALRSQMSAASDAAALAAVSELPNKPRAAKSALQYAELNMPEVANGKVLDPDDIEFGYWDRTHREFNSGVKPVNAVRVTLRRSQENNNPAPTFFLHIFGQSEADVVSQSLAGIVVPFIDYLGDPGLLSEAEQKVVAEMIRDIQEENKERMWDKTTKRYDKTKKMTPEEIEDFLMENYGEPALLR
jgi:hypothetical protein